MVQRHRKRLSILYQGCLLSAGILLQGCALMPYPLEKWHHLMKSEPIPAAISNDEGAAKVGEPAKVSSPVVSDALLPVEKPVPSPLLFSVVVHNVPVRELLFALARDAKINMDVHPSVSGTVSLNAYKQTFSQILSRLQRQASFRVEREQGTLVVVPDSAFMRNYAIDYVNVSRILKSEVNLSTAIATVGGSVSGAGGSTGQGNSSSTKLSNASEHQLWKSIVENIKDILKEEAPPSPVNTTYYEPVVPPLLEEDADNKEEVLPKSTKLVKKPRKVLPARHPSPLPSADRTGQVIANPETGVIAVWGTSRQHARVKSFVDQVMQQAQRQVLIEATIVEVVLSDAFQMGVDWSRLTQGTGLGSGLSFVQKRALDSTPFAALTYRDQSHDLSATLNLLETFGRTRVLSSPKIIALNNQTALLKVVDEKVYFSTQVKVTEATTTTPEKRDYTSEIKTVPVGVVMNVTPQISRDNQVSLSIRPTISRITGFKADPVPQLLGSDLQNLVPEIQVRELESMLKVADGQVVILGGLMQDSLQQNHENVPFLANLPTLGDLFKQRKDSGGKSELVIFLRPTIIQPTTPTVSANPDWSQWLPDEQFMNHDHIDGMSSRRGAKE